MVAEKIKHLLLSITLNSVSKFKTRVLPSILGFLKLKGSVPPLLSFSFAALIAFYKGENLANGELTGTRAGKASSAAGEAYPIRDDEAILVRFAELYAKAPATAEGARNLVCAVLKSADWWTEDLTQYKGLEEAVSAQLWAIWKDGIASAVKQVLR